MFFKKKKEKEIKSNLLDYNRKNNWILSKSRLDTRRIKKKIKLNVTLS